MIPTNADVKVQVKEKLPADAEAVIVFVAEGAKDAGEAKSALGPDENRAVEALLGSKSIRGKVKEAAVDLVEAGRGRYRRVIVAGLGRPQEKRPERVREAAGIAAKAARKHQAASVAVVVADEASADAAVSGVLLASFDYTEYKGAAGRKEKQEEGPKRVTLTAVPADGDAKRLRAAVERAEKIAEAQNFARTIASRPGNVINPPSLAKVSREMAREAGLSCRVLDEKEMSKLGMGGILAVGSGSILTPPRMIVLEHKPRGAAKSPGSGRRGGVRRDRGGPLLVVGKAITFDTGGISIKPAEKMGKMIYDKCGAMAVLGLMLAVARLKLPVHVVGILSAAENHISEKAYRPGDIVKMYNGVTVEVINTDAEGRLVLGDALAWGIEQYRPSAVVNLATLTGGIIVALGKSIAGVMSNDDGIAGEIAEAAQRAGEQCWRMPLYDEHREQIKSDFADIANSAGREASSLTAGAFLSHFVPWKDAESKGSERLIPWAHLDIAGVADTEKELPYYAKGATGWGVRTLVEWVSGRSELQT